MNIISAGNNVVRAFKGHGVEGALNMRLFEAIRTSDDGSRPPASYRVSDDHMFECRNCGAKFSENPSECVNCSSSEIAHYHFVA